MLLKCESRIYCDLRLICKVEVGRLLSQLAGAVETGNHKEVAMPTILTAAELTYFVPRQRREEVVPSLLAIIASAPAETDTLIMKAGKKGIATALGESTVDGTAPAFNKFVDAVNHMVLAELTTKGHLVSLFEQFVVRNA